VFTLCKLQQPDPTFLLGFPFLCSFSLAFFYSIIGSTSPPPSMGSVFGKRRGSAHLSPLPHVLAYRCLMRDPPPFSTSFPSRRTACRSFFLYFRLTAALPTPRFPPPFQISSFFFPYRGERRVFLYFFFEAATDIAIFFPHFRTPGSASYPVLSFF